MSENRIHMPQNWICQRHMAELPREVHGVAGAVVLSVTLFQAVASEPRIIKRSGQDADSSVLELLISEVAPWCCFLKPSEYRLCLDWAVQQRRSRERVDHEAWFRILEAHRRAA